MVSFLAIEFLICAPNERNRKDLSDGFEVESGSKILTCFCEVPGVMLTILRHKNLVVSLNIYSIQNWAPMGMCSLHSHRA